MKTMVTQVEEKISRSILIQRRVQHFKKQNNQKDLTQENERRKGRKVLKRNHLCLRSPFVKLKLFFSF